jgi:hypothetical protein
MTKNNARPRRNDAVKTLMTIVGFLLASVAFLAGLLWISTMFFVNTRPVQGDPAKFDLIANLPAIYEWVGTDAKLASMFVRYVKSDGTMDLFADYAPTVSLEFVRPIQNTSDKPLGAGGTESGIVYETVWVTISTPNQLRTQTTITNGRRSSVSYIQRGMELSARGTSENAPVTLPMPACSLKQLWAIALEEGFPSDAVATINYSTWGYSIDIKGTDYDLDFGFDCKKRE